MPIFIKENQELNGNQYKLPKRLVKHLKQLLGKYSDYKENDGYKRINALVTPSYNKRTDSNDFNDGSHISYQDMKTIDHDFRHMSKNPNDFKRILNGGEELAQFVSNKLKSERNKVEPVLKQKKVETRNKNKLKPPTNPMKPLKVNNMELNIRESLIKEEYSIDHPYYDYLNEYNAYNVLLSFLNKENIWTPLINPSMYKKALMEFTKYGHFIKFPTKYIYQWMGIIMKNTAILRTLTDLNGHSSYFPTDDFVDVFFEGDYDKWKEYKKEKNEHNDYYVAYEILEQQGFKEWCILQDNSSAYSDYGLEPLEKIICEYDETSTPEETIVIINKALDITHWRGDLALIFITGGSKTLSQISEDIKKDMTKKIYINENQLNIIKNNIY